MNWLYLKIKDYKQEDRPREKLLKHGKERLSDSELLGLVIGSGFKKMNAVDLARQLLKKYNNDLHMLSRASVTELQQVKGIGPAKAALLRGILELSNRLSIAPKEKKVRITESRIAYDVIRSKFFKKVVEECWVILLNANNRLLNLHALSKGGINKTTMDIALVLKEALLWNAPKIILTHNHPSQNTEPSAADIALTEQLARGAKAMNIQLLDHLIIADHGYFSFADQGLIG